MHRSYLWLPSMLCLTTIAMHANAPAATMVLEAVSDASLFQAKPDADLGGTSLVAGTNQLYSRGRAMFRFDVAGIPAGAVISEVVVSLHVTRRPDPDQHGGPADSDFSLYRLFVSWGEGPGSDVTGSAAVPGAATWNERHFGSTSWASPGGQTGTDFANNPSATTSISDVGEYHWGSSAALVNDVRAWMDDPATNFGFMLISQDEASLGSGRRFASKEQPGGLIPPARLTITYTMVPETSTSLLVMTGLAWIMLGRRSRGVLNRLSGRPHSTSGGPGRRSGFPSGPL